MKKDEVTRFEVKKNGEKLFELVGNFEKMGEAACLLIYSGKGYSVERIFSEEVTK